jgi:hypothetical protein
MSEVLIPPGMMEGEYHEAFAEQLTIPNPLDSRLGSFTSATAPIGRKAKIKKAKEYCGIDIVDRILRIKVDFGFRLQEMDGFESVRQRDFYNENVLPLIQEIIPSYIYDRNSVGDVFFHYADKPDSKTPMFLTIEDPERVEIETVLGIEQYNVDLSSTFKEDVKKLQQRGQLDKLPLYLRKAIDGNGMIKNRLPLDNENMFRIDFYRRKYDKYSEPPLMRISVPLELRNALTDMDYTATYGLKKGILHFKVGNDKDPKSKDPSKIEALKKLVTSQPPGAFMLFTNSDVSVEYQMPKAEIWSASKYDSSEKRILEWSGISTTIISGEGSAYATATISLSGLQRQLIADREAFEKFLTAYCRLINKKNNFRKIPKFIWERESLENNTDFLARIKFLIGQGVYGIEDICREFKLDFDEQKKKKQRDAENREIFIPHFEEKQGIVANEFGVGNNSGGEDGETNGRPKTNNMNVRDTKQPRPSQ